MTIIPLSDEDFERKLNEMIGFFYTLQEARDFEQVLPTVEEYTEVLRQNTDRLTEHRFTKKFKIILRLGLRKGVELQKKLQSQGNRGVSSNP